jgi:hypothetical protein
MAAEVLIAPVAVLMAVAALMVAADVHPVEVAHALPAAVAVEEVDSY